jgi:hypothetical protein
MSSRPAARVRPTAVSSDLRPPKAGERPTGRRRQSGVAKPAEAGAGA